MNLTFSSSFICIRCLVGFLTRQAFLDSSFSAQFAMTNKFFQWFFFTWTTQKHPDAKNSTRASRVAGPGRWKSTQSVRLVRNDFGRVIGSKQKFCYMEHTTQGKEEKTIWLMEEYSIKSLRTGGGADMPKDKKKVLVMFSEISHASYHGSTCNNIFCYHINSISLPLCMAVG